VVGVGMLVGALAAGSIADRWGRRRALITAVALFSAAMGCCALAPSPETFGATRFVVGVGAGVLMPTAASVLIEFSRLDTRARTVALGFVGTSVGGIGAGLLSLWLVPAFGFRAMFAAGMIPALVILPMMVRYLPESPAFLTSQGRTDEAQRISTHYGLEEAAESAGGDTKSTDRGIGALFAANRARVTLSFWVMTLLCLLVLFGVATWLPAVMRSAGYPLGAALSFLLVLNVGGAVGALGGAYLADRFGIKLVTSIGFLCAAVSLALIATTPPIGIVYVLVLVAGMGTTGTQILLHIHRRLLSGVVPHDRFGHRPRGRQAGCHRRSHLRWLVRSCRRMHGDAVARVRAAGDYRCRCDGAGARRSEGLRQYFWYVSLVYRAELTWAKLPHYQGILTLTADAQAGRKLPILGLCRVVAWLPASA
jgi:AAHS family benzoate transporter-like MFS transporter